MAQVLLFVVDLVEVFIDFFLFPDEVISQLGKIADPFVFDYVVITGEPP